LDTYLGLQGLKVRILEKKMGIRSKVKKRSRLFLEGLKFNPIA